MQSIICRREKHERGVKRDWKIENSEKNTRVNCLYAQPLLKTEGLTQSILTHTVLMVSFSGVIGIIYLPYVV